jgi:branched-chain amino acid transport system permease protein
MAEFITIVFSALTQSAVLALVTLGIVLIFRTSFTTNFAQGLIGTLIAFFVTMFQVFTIQIWFPTMSIWLQLVIAMVVGMVIAFILGVLIDVVLIRLSKFPNPLVKQMITMGIVLVITGLIPTIYRDVIDNPPTPSRLSNESLTLTLSDGLVYLQWHNIYTIIISIVVISVVFIMLKYTKWGLGLRATASNEVMAGVMGVNTKMITAISWGIAAAIGALAASLYAPNVRTLSLGLMTFMQVNAFLAAVLGGFTSFIGPIVGAILIPLMSVLLYWQVTTTWNVVIVYFLILLVVLFKPEGLFGKKIAKKV